VRISAIALARIKRHKNDGLLSILAITLTVLASTVVFTTLDLFNDSIQAYYQPIEDYNMILEKHGTMVQFFPLDSNINDSIVETIEHDLELVVHPASFKVVDETIQSVIPNVLVGLTTTVLVDIFTKQKLYGRAPRPGFLEVVTGSSIQFLSNGPIIGENITIFNSTFTIVGTIPFDNPIMDNYIFTTYEMMQASLHLNGTCNLLFLKRDGQVDENHLEYEIESRYPTLKFITIDEVDVLSNDIIFNASSWNGFLVIFTLFICISFPLTAFFINHDKIFKEIRLLRLIGTPRVKILLFKCQENLLLFAIGAIIGYIIAMFVFPLFTLAAFSMQGLEFDAWGLYKYTFTDVQPNVFSGFVTLSGALLPLGPAVLLLPYAWTIGRVEHAFTARKKTSDRTDPVSATHRII
jgi:hypothetical protein